MNSKVRTYLIELAKANDKIVYYKKLINDCSLGFDLAMRNGQRQLVNTLLEIARFENLHNRPMLTSLVIAKQTHDQGLGFYKLAQEFGYGKKEELQTQGWGKKEARKVREYWQNETYYKKFAHLRPLEEEIDKIEYFTKKELDLFQRYHGEKYNSIDKEDIKAGQFIKDTVFEKTLYLGKKIENELTGFKTEGNKHWLQRGYKSAVFKSYTWVKVFKIINQEKDIYFTFGISAAEKGFIYKIDCQDEGNTYLKPKQIVLFKSLTANRKYWNEIPFKDLIKGNWDSLTQICLEFINTHIPDYNSLINTVWGDLIPSELPKNTLIETERPEGRDKQILKEKGRLKGVVIDYEARRKEQKELGNAGEELVKLSEIKYLAKNRKEKAGKVKIVMDDGLGYDVYSFDKFGNEKLIEVKTTKGNINTPFFLSRPEVEFMRKNKGKYFIYRVYNYNAVNNSAWFYKLDQDVESQLELEPSEYKVSIKKKA